MACGIAAAHLCIDATTVTCRGFQAFAPGQPLPPSLALGDYQITARGQATLVVEPACGEMPSGLQFDGQGIEVNLPLTTVAVTLQLGSCVAQPIMIAGFNRAGQQVDQQAVAGDGAIHTVTLVAADLASLQLTAGGKGGRLVQICSASSTMQTILEDYFAPLALPIRLLPYADAARRLFASYYLRPQGTIVQGRLGSSDGIAMLSRQHAGHRPTSHGVPRYDIPGDARRPLLGYDGFYVHAGVQGELRGENQCSGGCLSPNWEAIRQIAMTLPLTVAAPTLLANVAHAAGVAVAEIPLREWLMKKAVSVLVEIGFAHRVAAAAIPYLTADAELAAAWLICADVLG